MVSKANGGQLTGPTGPTNNLWCDMMQFATGKKKKKKRKENEEKRRRKKTELRG